MKALGEICPRARWLHRGLLFRGTQVEICADNLDASDHLLHLILGLILRGQKRIFLPHLVRIRILLPHLVRIRILLPHLVRIRILLPHLVRIRIFTIFTVLRCLFLLLLVISLGHLLPQVVHPLLEACLALFVDAHL